MGFPFLRQRPIGNYIADFLSKDLNLIIEVDGLSHNGEVRSLKKAKSKNSKKGKCVALLLVKVHLYYIRFKLKKNE